MPRPTINDIKNLPEPQELDIEKMKPSALESIVNSALDFEHQYFIEVVCEIKSFQYRLGVYLPEEKERLKTDLTSYVLTHDIHVYRHLKPSRLPPPAPFHVVFEALKFVDEDTQCT